MAQVYVIKNQNNEFLEKSGDWVTAETVKSLYKTAFKDEAINQKVEIAVKQPDLRLSLLEVGLDEKGHVVLNNDLLEQLQSPANQDENTFEDLAPIPEYSEDIENASPEAEGTQA